MPVFTYVARTTSGQVIKGTQEADSTRTVQTSLKQKGLYPVDIKLNYQSKSLALVLFNRVKTKDLAILMRQFATILKAGVPVVKCLDLLRKQTESKKLTEVLNKIYESVQKGILLSEAMREQQGVFSVVILNMIEAGEISGNIDNALEKIATQLEKDVKLKQKIKGSLTYPVIMLVISAIAVAILLTFVIPQFSEIFDSMGIPLPITTKILLDIGNFMKSYWYIVGIVVIAIVGGLIYFKNSSRGKDFFDRLFLKLPIISPVMRKVLAARFTRLASTMLSSGVSLIQTLDVAQRVVNNVVAEEGIRKVQEDVTRGGGLSGPINEMGLFPTMVSQMISIGEESGSLDEMLGKTADFCEDEVDTSITQLTTLIEPLILLVMAFVIGFIVISIVLPMFQITSEIG